GNVDVVDVGVGQGALENDVLECAGAAPEVGRPGHQGDVDRAVGDGPRVQAPLARTSAAGEGLPGQVEGAGDGEEVLAGWVATVTGQVGQAEGAPQEHRRSALRGDAALVAPGAAEAHQAGVGQDLMAGVVGPVPVEAQVAPVGRLQQPVVGPGAAQGQG